MSPTRRTPLIGGSTITTTTLTRAAGVAAGIYFDRPLEPAFLRLRQMAGGEFRRP